MRTLFILFITLAACCTASTAPPRLDRLGSDPYDPDDRRNFTQMVENEGYPSEWHDVITKDGYILSMARLPNKGPPVLLNHGFLDNCFSWIFNYHTYQNLAYILWNRGYDVWLSNNRGNNFSKRHVHISPDDDAFWQFSFDEMAKYDTPAFLSYILNLTSHDKMAYIGHSEGTANLMAAASIDPQVQNMVSIFIGLGPVGHVSHAKGIIVDIFRDTPILQFIALFGKRSFMPTPTTLSPYLGDLCRIFPDLCVSVVEIICGWHHGSLNTSRQQVMATHEPGGSSVMNMLHWQQLLKNGNFRMYDWGSDELNMQHYHQTTPPTYDLDVINIPTALFYGTGDNMIQYDDIEWLLKTLNHTTVYSKVLDNYAHLDYIWDIDAYQTIYVDVVELLSKFIDA